MIETWFRDLLAEHVKELSDHRGRGGVSALARYLDIPRETVDRWVSGVSAPDIVTGGKIVDRLGGNIRRALPTYKEAVRSDRTVVYEESETLTSDAGSNRIFIAGQVSAGKVTFAGEDQHFKLFDELWDESRYWGLTTGEVVFVEVHGESMSPEYKPGEVLACRRPSDPLQLPNGAPCIFQDGDEDSLTFKILRTSDSGDIIGQPLNPDYPMVIFKRKSVRIALVVLGKVQLEKRTMNQALVETKPRKKTVKKQK